jgi:hypothetical protein
MILLIFDNINQIFDQLIYHVIIIVRKLFLVLVFKVPLFKIQTSYNQICFCAKNTQNDTLINIVWVFFAEKTLKP